MATKKNNIFKSLISASIAAASIMSMSFSAFADEVDNRYAINLYETPSAEANNLKANSSRGEQAMTLNAAHKEKTLAVPYHNQENNWYCGPATALQTYDYFYRLRYGRATTMTQDQMKTNIKTSETYGTTVQYMLDYLNSCGLGCNYEQQWVWNNSVTYYTNQVCKAIDAGVPVIAWVKSPDSTSPLGYTTPGHLLNISGYKDSGNWLELTDPNYTGHNELNETGKHYVTNSAIENITNTISYYF